MTEGFGPLSIFSFFDTIKILSQPHIAIAGAYLDSKFLQNQRHKHFQRLHWEFRTLGLPSHKPLHPD
ncbi:MAG: hypothetical protein A2Y50_07140 [Pseudomonadales bacterium RIFCSPLOWO2_12_59_9]|nr:MAG: hypothetical protein A2Y50_07140 [Pseudomonadales bacterium RIFCSPLOWO2_12_59_9]